MRCVLSICQFGILLVLIVFSTGPMAAELSRVQALKDLNSVQAEVRIAAVERLSVVGLASDSEALVARLKDADESVRQVASDALWQVWARSGDKAIDKLYQRGMSEMAAGQAQQAIKTFSEIIKLKPGFAEAWNKRATVYYFIGEWEKSRTDCDEVMKRNPHHFGALCSALEKRWFEKPTSGSYWPFARPRIFASTRCK
jgi:tetratricopeptide (TPR) repeat protein